MVPVAMSWELPGEVAALVREGRLPYRLRVVARGERGAWVEIVVLPEDTIAYELVDGCCGGACCGTDVEVG